MTACNHFSQTHAITIGRCIGVVDCGRSEGKARVLYPERGQCNKFVRTRECIASLFPFLPGDQCVRPDDVRRLQAMQCSISDFLKGFLPTRSLVVGVWYQNQLAVSIYILEI